MTSEIESVSNAITSSSLLIQDLTQGEIIVEKNKQILLKTRKRWKKEHHLLVIATNECKYHIVDLRNLETRLKEIKDMLKKKLITQEEYDLLKSNLLQKYLSS